MSSDRLRIALLAALTGVAVLFCGWLGVSRIGLLARLDHSALRGFRSLSATGFNDLAPPLISFGDPAPFTAVGLGAVLIALLRRRPWLAAGVVLLLIGATLSTEVLKPLLATPHPTVSAAGDPRLPAPGSYPSGHATAVMALALALCLVAPPALRSAVAVTGAVIAVLVAFGMLTLEVHYPSDVFGGYLVAWVWTMLSVAAVTAVEHRRRVPAERRPDRFEQLAPVGAAAALGAVLALIAFLARPGDVIGYVAAHGLFVLAGLALFAVALALSASLVVVAHR